MKLFLRVVVVLALVPLVWCQDALQNTKADKPISKLAWLVGGVWIADTSKMGPGLQRIETRYQWSDNDAYIRFTSHFVSDKETERRYDGSFYWDPRKSSLEMWYMDASNAIKEGPVTLSGEKMQMTFSGEDSNGKLVDYRVTVTQTSADRYSWLLDEKVTQDWKSLLTLEFIRSQARD
jgi:hypothetical protein